jgi:hypothetical protein
MRQGGAKATVEELTQLMGKAYLSDMIKPTEDQIAEDERLKEEELQRLA